MTLNAAVQSGTLTPEVQEKLIDELWNPRVISSEKNTRNTSTYLRYYRDQCEQSLVDRGRYSSARRHEDILHVAKLISKDQLGHEEILQRLRTQCDDDQRQNVTDDALRGTMNLAARLLSMMKIGTWRYEFSSQKRIHWTGGTLQQCISGWFEGPTLDHENIKLEKLFNGANLGTISGLKIVWTDNIAEHLSLQNNDQEVVTFHHASFLKGHGTSILSDAVRQETLDTLALLFPQTDKAIRNCFRKWQSDSDGRLDPELIRCGSLCADARQIERFHYWRDRLVILKQVFDDAEPKTLNQWWNDRRKRVQWSTFWVAMLVLLLTIFFGVIQSIEGALQVYKAYHPS